MRMIAIATLTFALATQAYAGRTCDVTKFGAKADAVTNNAAAIQKALDTCSVIKVPAGTFITGPLVLRSNTTLYLDPKAVLLGSPNMADFPRTTFARRTVAQPFISATNAENITITGGGTLDGNGHIWWEYVKGMKDAGILGNDHPRPMGIVLDHVKHARLENVTMQNAGFWQIVPYYADDVVIRNVKILAPHSPNTDAVDPFSSSHVVIDHVYSSIGDDNIAIKSGDINSPGPDSPSEYITITDCTFEKGHGLSIGSEIAGGAHHIHAERIHFKGTDQGIRIKAARDRGNDVSDITFKDIDMDGVKNAILVTEYYPEVFPEGEVKSAPVTRLTPHFHDIHIENVRAVNSDSVGTIVGLPESPVVDISLKNVHLEGKKGMRIAYAKVLFDDVSFRSTVGERLMVSPTATITSK